MFWWGMKNFIIFSANTVYRETIAAMAVDFGLNCLASESVNAKMQISIKEITPEIVIIDIFSRGATDDFVAMVREIFLTARFVFIVSEDNPLLSYFVQKYNVHDLLFVEDDTERTRSNLEKIVKSKSNGSTSCNIGNLTLRECEVLKLIAAGKTSREIAEELFISKNTVDTHRNKMLQKLNLSNSASLVTYACKSGLL
jgi:DNA-binding NarL/FixJ family response regulator